MKILFHETLDRYIPDRDTQTVDIRLIRIEALYDADMQVARLVVLNEGDTTRGAPVHASSSVSAVKQMLAAYENAVDALPGYPDYDLAYAALTHFLSDPPFFVGTWTPNVEAINAR